MHQKKGRIEPVGPLAGQVAKGLFRDKRDRRESEHTLSFVFHSQIAFGGRFGIQNEMMVNEHSVPSLVD